MKVIIFLNILLLILGNSVFSQVSITGKITDKSTGEALLGATIFIPDLKTGTVSDTAGFYKIENLPKTKVLVQVSFIGYKTIASVVDLNSVSAENFEMEETVAEMNTVVVTGTSNATEIKKNPVPIMVIDCKIINCR